MQFEREDFVINQIQRRIYGNQTLIYVNIKNIKTGKEFEDWVRPNQIYSLRELNELISWD